MSPYLKFFKPSYYYKKAKTKKGIYPPPPPPHPTKKKLKHSWYEGSSARNSIVMLVLRYTCIWHICISTTHSTCSTVVTLVRSFSDLPVVKRMQCLAQYYDVTFYVNSNIIY